VINDLVVFSNDGHKFVLIMNGEKYNEEPSTNVKVTGLVLKKYEVRVIFDSKRIKDLNTTLTFYNTGKECVFGLNRHGKKYSMDYVSSTDIPGFVNPMTSTTTTTSTQVNTNNNTSSNSTYHPTTSNTTSTSTNTGTYSTNNSTTNSQNSNSINVHAGVFNIGLNENGKINIGTKEGNLNVNAKNPSGNVTLGQGPNSITLNKAAKVGCNGPMNTLQFEGIKSKITTQTTEASKLIAAKSLLESNCYTTSQVKEVMNMFSEDSNKLDYAKNAYLHTNDLNNYKELKEEFKKDENKEAFLKYVKSMK
jgi:hypothetical protein